MKHWLLALVRLPPPQQETALNSLFGMSESIDAFLYSILLNLARLCWYLDAAILWVIDMLTQWRTALATQGFTTALDAVAENAIGMSRPVFNLALVSFALLAIMTPLLRTEWVNIRKAVLIAVLLPLVLPGVAASFQDIDGARSDLGGSLYSQIVSDASDDFGGGGSGVGAERDLCPIVAFSPPAAGMSGYRGVDVAAAYLCATRDDVFVATESLPHELKQRYFPLTATQVEELPDPERADAIDKAATGLKRLAFGIVLLLFALMETCVSLGFTISLGFLLISLFLSGVLAMFAIFEGFFQTVVQKIAALFLQSWIISAMQALMIAMLLKVAESGSTTAVFGTGLVCLVLEKRFLNASLEWMSAAVSGVVGAAGQANRVGRMARAAGGMGGTLAGGAGRIAGAGGSIAGGIARTVGQTVAAPLHAAAAYDVARQSGASRSFARGYAVQSNTPLATVGRMAALMGYSFSEDAQAGSAYGQRLKARSGLTSFQARHEIGSYAASHAQMQVKAADQARRDEEARVRAEREAPIKAIDRGQIASQMAKATAIARRQQATTPVAAHAVAEGLGLSGGAFGAKSKAIQTVLDDLHQTPLTPDLSYQMMLEAGQTGMFSPETADKARADLIASGMSASAAAKRVTAMQTHMAALPSGVKVEDAFAAEADAAGVNPFGGFRDAYQAATRVEPIITPNRQPILTAEAESRRDERTALPAPTPPDRPKRAGRPRPRSRI